MAHQVHYRHFKISDDISILDKFVILGLPFCVFAGYIVLTYALNRKKEYFNGLALSYFSCTVPRPKFEKE